jgi:hypothetical protein
VVVHGYGQRLLSPLLPYDILVEELLDLLRLRDLLQVLFGVFVQLFRYDLIA